MSTIQKNILLIAIGLLGSPLYMSGQVSFNGNLEPIIKEIPAASTGLNAVYVVYNTNGMSLNYKSQTGTQSVKWSKYSNLGGAYAEEILGIQYDGTTSTLSNIIPNTGYIIEDGDKQERFWIVNYADYYLHLGSIIFENDYNCDLLSLEVSGSGNDISYYSINGQHLILDRDISITYNSLQWNTDNNTYEPFEQKKELESYKNIIETTAPLCNTTFTINGDKFLRYWGMPEEIISDEYETKAVEVQATATQKNNDGYSVSVLGGSAPANIEFNGYTTDAVIFKEWQIASDAEFENILYRFTDQDIDYTFNEAGTFYVRFYGANVDATCESWSETFEINIGESHLKCPNAFSPQSSEGINDIWKVSYKSIINFECHIFNRWGVEMTSFKDPSQGWDGKYKGKYVDSGVYFYAITAKGADGRNYKLKGDINIINYKK